MKSRLNFLSIVLIAIGSIWILQGINILPVSFMSGQPRWTINGSIAAAVGVALLIWTNVIRRKAQ